MWVSSAVLFGPGVGGVGRLHCAGAATRGVSFGLVAGAAELLAPRTFLEWREADAQSSTRARQGLEVVDAALGTSRDHSGEFAPAAIRRLRIVGGLVFTGSVLLAGGLVAAGKARPIP